MSWYHYTYFKNGWNFFDINGNLRGDEELIKLMSFNNVGSGIDENYNLWEMKI